MQDVYENNVPPDPPWYGTSWQVLLELTWSDVRRQPEARCFGSEMCEIIYVVGSADEVRRFAPLPRTVYLVHKVPVEEISPIHG